MHTLSIKINPTLAETLATLLQREQVSKSELVRRALEAYALQRSQVRVEASPSALDMAGDLVGCLVGSPPDLSSNPAYLADYGRI